jgi:hypothetical protein
LTRPAGARPGSTGYSHHEKKDHAGGGHPIARHFKNLKEELP